MRVPRFLMHLTVLGLMAAPAAAQGPVVYATSPTGGLQHSVGMALGKVVNEVTGLQLRVVPHGGSAQYLPLIDQGQLDVGMTADAEIQFAINGTGWFKEPMKNLRAIGPIMRWDTALIVRKDSDIKDIGELKGKPMTVGYRQHRMAHRFYLANLASAGLKEDDFEGIPVPHLGKAAQEFMEGNVPSLMFPRGAGKLQEVSAKVGGVRFLSAVATPEALEHIREVLPGAYITELGEESGDKMITGPTNFISADYVLFAGAHVQDEVAYKFAKTLYEEQARLGAALGNLKSYDPDRLGRDMGYPHHPGAIKYYKEIGIWQGK